MIREQELAAQLIKTLSAHVVVCNLQDAHYDKVLNAEFSSKAAEKSSYRDLEIARVPYIKMAIETGFSFDCLKDIIPSSFSTTCEERKEVFENLREWATWYYNLGGYEEHAPKGSDFL